MVEYKGRANRLGIWGWLGGGRWGAERYLYTLHRVTGLGILAYFLLHIFVTSARAFGADAWAASIGRVTGPLSPSASTSCSRRSRSTPSTACGCS